MVKNEIKEDPADTSSGLWIEERQVCRDISPLLAERWIALEMVTSWAGLTFPTKPALTSGAGEGHHNWMRSPRAVLVSRHPLATSSISELQ